MCGGCNLYEPWAALLVGCGGGFFYLLGHKLVLKARLDDPLDAIAVHGFGGKHLFINKDGACMKKLCSSGLWGITAVPFFMYAGLQEGSRGILWDGHLSAPWSAILTVFLVSTISSSGTCWATICLVAS